MIKKIVLVFALLLMSFVIRSNPSSRTEVDSWEKDYAEGEKIFYAVLKKMAVHVPLEEADRKKILEAQKRIPHLYEHLMNYYSFVEPEKQGGTKFEVLSRPFQSEWQRSLWNRFLPAGGQKKHLPLNPSFYQQDIAHENLPRISGNS